MITTEIKNVRVGGGKIKNPTWHKDLGHTDDDRSMVMRSCYDTWHKDLGHTDDDLSMEVRVAAQIWNCQGNLAK